MAKKKNPFDLLAAKEAKKAKSVNSKNSSSDKESVNSSSSKKSINSKTDISSKESSKSVNSKNSNNDRKLIRVHNEIHHMARWNDKRMELGSYIEALITLDQRGAIDWTDFTPLELVTPHDKEKKRTLFRILPPFHELAKWNPQEMKLQNYVEGLVQLDKLGKVDWKKE